MKTKNFFVGVLFLFTVLITTSTVAQDNKFFYEVIERYDVKLGSKTGSSVPTNLYGYLENHKIVRVDYYDVVILYYPSGWSVTVERFDPMLPQNMLFLSSGQKRYWITITPDGEVVSVEKNILKDQDVSNVYIHVPVSDQEKKDAIRELRKEFPGIKE